MPTWMFLESLKQHLVVVKHAGQRSLLKFLQHVNVEWFLLKQLFIVNNSLFVVKKWSPKIDYNSFMPNEFYYWIQMHGFFWKLLESTVVPNIHDFEKLHWVPNPNGQSTIINNRITKAYVSIDLAKLMVPLIAMLNDKDIFVCVHLRYEK